MSHPASRCSEAARLQRVWQDACTLYNDMPEVLRKHEIDMQRKDKAWQVAYTMYTTHVHDCPVCQAAIKEESYD